MVNTTELSFTSLQRQILHLLFTKAGTAMNHHQIAQALGVTSPAVRKALPALEKAHLITLQQEESKRWAVRMDRGRDALQRKRIDNLRTIHETGLADALEQAFAGATIILFGSYSRGEDTLTSDIDIAVVGRKEKSIDLNRFERLMERKIILQFYPSFSVIHKHLKENLCNGIVLAGGIEL